MLELGGKYFDPEKIYESGQVLLGWKKDGSDYLVTSLDKTARVMEVKSSENCQNKDCDGQKTKTDSTPNTAGQEPKDSQDKDDGKKTPGISLTSEIRPEEKVYRILCPDEDNVFWENYFDLSCDYEAIEKAAVGFEKEYKFEKYQNRAGQERTKDEYLSAALEYGRGIRMLRQDLWEALCSFIVSQNNNIPRITKSIVKIQNGRDHFPTPEELYADRERLVLCGLGYRDEYLKRLCEELHAGKRKLTFSENTEEAYKQLLEIHGVGPKVANCVLLFGLHRMERCPVDTWMRKVFENHYGGKQPAWTKFPYAGYYQQVTFFYEINYLSKQ